MLAVARLTLALAALLASSMLAPAGWTMVAPGSPGPISECTDIGIYRLLDSPRRRPALETTAGYRSVVRADLVEPTIEVPLELGQAFGFRFSIADASASAPWLPVEFDVRHPPIPDHSGQPRRRFTVNTSARRGSDGRYSNRVLYILSESRELVDGAWQLRVRYRGNTICTAHFELSARRASASGLAARPRGRRIAQYRPYPADSV